MEQLCVNGKDYTILKILGKGKGGYSYLATIDDKKVVLKQIHHEPCSYYQFGNKIEAEQNDYHRLKNIGIAMPKMIEIDVKEERIVKEYIDGKTAYEMVLNDELPPDCIEQVKHMCSLLYPANTNIDYFPTNFVLQDKILYYIDVILIWMSGILKIGGLNTGLKPQSFSNTYQNMKEPVSKGLNYKK